MREPRQYPQAYREELADSSQNHNGAHRQVNDSTMVEV